MSKWNEKFSDHPVHESINLLKQSLAEIENIKEKLGIEEVEAFERLVHVSKFVCTSLEWIDPSLTPLKPLTSLNQHTQYTIDEVNNFLSNHSVSHLNSANTHADNMITSLSNLPFIKFPEDMDGIRDAVVSLRRSFGQLLRNLDMKVEISSNDLAQLQQKISETTQEVVNQKSRLDNAISQFQQQFSEAENRRREETGQTEKERKVEHEATIEEYKEKHDGLIKQASKSIDTFEKELKDQAENLTAQLGKKADEILSEMESHLKKAQRLVTVISNTGMVGGYQKIANHSRKIGLFWQLIAFLALISLIGFAIYTFRATLEGVELSWSSLGTRAFVVIGFGILAAYAARQADRYFLTERSNRKMELELASLDPFILDLPEEKKQEIKEHLAESFFAKQETIDKGLTKDEVSGSVRDLLRLALESIKNLTRKA